MSRFAVESGTFCREGPPRLRTAVGEVEDEDSRLPKRIDGKQDLPRFFSLIDSPQCPGVFSDAPTRDGKRSLTISRTALECISTICQDPPWALVGLDEERPPPSEGNVPH